MDDQLTLLLEKYKDVLAIVEGKKDRAALEHFGFSNIFSLTGPLYAMVEDILATGEKKVMILTDLDVEGIKLYEYLRTHLTQKGMHIDNTLRDYLSRETTLRQIERLVTYVNARNS
jgi:5S rRNA maturation endonuclease (ribonuclease M5)